MKCYRYYQLPYCLFTSKELIDPKASEQVLELIVKIAEHPATWKQIHRVLGKNPSIDDCHVLEIQHL